MGASVRLTAEPDVEKQYLVDGTDLSRFTDFRFGNRVRAMKRTQSGKWDWRFSVEFCSRAAQSLRRSGNPLWASARAFDSSGLLVGGEPPIQSTAPVTGTTYTTAQAADGTYRQVPPVRKATGGYYIDLHVFFGGRWQDGTVRGSTPNEAIQRLFEPNPLYEAFVATLPIEDAPDVSATAAVDLSTVTAMSEKEYAAVPSAELSVGGRYFKDPIFKHRVDLFMRKRRANEAARKAAAQSEDL